MCVLAPGPESRLSSVGLVVLVVARLKSSSWHIPSESLSCDKKEKKKKQYHMSVLYVLFGCKGENASAAAVCLAPNCYSNSMHFH